VLGILWFKNRATWDSLTDDPKTKFGNTKMKRLWLALLAGSVLTLSGLAGCSQAPTAEQAAGAPIATGAGADSNQESAIAQDVNTPKADTQKTNPASQESAASESQSNAKSASRPQLIKRANLALRVESVDEAFKQVGDIVKAQQGDILSLQDQGGASLDSLGQRQITLELRVPQAQLDPTVETLSKVGTVINRSLETEDVSSQLVDLQARLSNAQKSEEALRKLMERSGAITDVLQVSRELSTVRSSIEQMAAQQKSLQAQVSYSTVHLSLQSAIALSPDQPAISRQLSNTWKSATYSVSNFTTGVLKLSLWLFAYSPYIAIMLCGALVARKIARRSTRDRGS
jgi:hypothetical protein